MTYQGHLPPGQAYNGQQQHMPQQAYHQQLYPQFSDSAYLGSPSLLNPQQNSQQHPQQMLHPHHMNQQHQVLPNPPHHLQVSQPEPLHVSHIPNHIQGEQQQHHQFVQPHVLSMSGPPQLPGFESVFSPQVQPSPPPLQQYSPVYSQPSPRIPMYPQQQQQQQQQKFPQTQPYTQSQLQQPTPPLPPQPQQQRRQHHLIHQRQEIAAQTRHEQSYASQPPPPPPQLSAGLPQTVQYAYPPEAPRPRSSQSPALTNSPAHSTRSPSVTKNSPALSVKNRLGDPIPLLVCVAEECFEKARGSLVTEASKFSSEYQQLVSTGLACLETVIQSNRLSPRQEAKTRLRYAEILCEEIENQMLAETVLVKGITLCDKHRLLDLKYTMEYLHLKVLFQRNQKAAFKAVDKHIEDATARRHPAWLYAFRFLKSFFYLNSGNGSDTNAIENLRAIATFAGQRGDHALSIFASLLEGLAILKTTKEDGFDRVQECIAKASRYQLEVRIPQIDTLILVLDLACSMHQRNVDMTSKKLAALQQRMDESNDWESYTSSIHLPMKKQGTMPQTISSDTSAIIRPGNEGDCHDFLVMSFVTKVEFYVLVMTYSGFASLSRPAGVGQKQRSMDYWEEALHTIERWNRDTGARSHAQMPSAYEAVRRATWLTEVQCYLYVLVGLFSATHSKWPKVKECLDNLNSRVGTLSKETMGLMTLYLSGVYHQGTGDLAAALSIFQDPRFEITDARPQPRCPTLDVSLLANMNALWIMQHPSYENESESTRIFGLIQPLCLEHPDVEIRTAFNLVLATIKINPAPSMNQVKNSMYTSLNGSKTTGNTHCLAIALNIMRCRLFENVVGEQALKSAKAASAQAKKSGNLLWMSVADGMLAHSHEVQGQVEEARRAQETATAYAAQALRGESA